MIAISMRVSSTNHRIPMTIATDQVTLRTAMSVAYKVVDSDPYEGDYEVTPRLVDQILETHGKFMRNDVTVYQIPISRVSNPQDGLTVLIG